MEWPEEELTLWDLVPEEERICEASYVHLLSRSDVAEQCHVRSVCSHPWCAPCEEIRVWRLQNKIKRYLEYHSPERVWMVTKSVRNTFRLSDAFRNLHLCNNKFTTACRRAPDNPLSVISCWIATYEITFSLKTGYHLHQHALMGTNGEKLDYAVWHRLWDQAAMYKAQLHFVQVREVESAANYVGKYISKGTWGGLSRGRAYLVGDTLYGRNRIVTKQGSSLPRRFPRFYLCCFPPDKYCCSMMGGWDPDKEGQ